jgi:hypothetical protein
MNTTEFLSKDLKLPLRDGALFIDNTFLEALTTCPRACEYSQVRKRILAGDRPSLNFGSAIHLALDFRYSSFGTDLENDEKLAQCEQGQSDLLQRYFEQNPPIDGDWRNLNWALEVVKQYNIKYRVEPFNVLHHEVNGEQRPMVEMPFVLPIAYYRPKEFRNGGASVITPANEMGVIDAETGKWIPIFYQGKIDLPTEWEGRNIFIADHKTSSVLGQNVEDEHRVSPQQTGYAWAWWKITGTMPIGFMVNIIRSKAKPERTPKGGWGAWWEESFHRLKEYVDERHFAEWEFNTLQLIEEFLWHFEREYFPLKRKWCVGKFGKCQFYEACYTQPASVRLELLNSDSYMDNEWSPLKEIIV